MDFQNFVDGFYTSTCVVSIEKKDGGYGDIRIVTGNQKFIDTAEHPAYATAPDAPVNKFIPTAFMINIFPRRLISRQSASAAQRRRRPFTHISTSTS